MNVYLYGGKGRANATESLIDNNQMVKIGKNYTVPIDSGMLLIVYPEKD